MRRYGFTYALVANLIWGLFPLFWKQLEHVGDIEILSHRTAWAAVFMVIVISIRRSWRPLFTTLGQPKVILLSLISAIAVGWNWYIYIYAVNNGFIIETSMGYFITPLISVLFGTLFFRERLRNMQWLAIIIAAMGVAYLIIQYQQIPWIALILAVSFASYGLIKKYILINALHSMTLETCLLFIPAVAIIAFQLNTGNAAFGQEAKTDSLLILGGVLTVIPLIFFSAAAQRISLSLLGISQYLTPTLQLLIGIWIFNEPFRTVQFIAFGCIWLGLLMFTLEGLHQQRKAKKLAVTATSG